MDKKKPKSPLDDIRGFEEFLEDHPVDKPFLPRGVGGGTKKDVSFEHFTFLTNDNERLTNLKKLLSTKIPFSRRYEQGKKIIETQTEEIQQYRGRLFEAQDAADSGYRKSLREIFDGHFRSEG